MLLHLRLTLHATEYYQAGVMDVHFSLFSLQFTQNFTTTTKRQVGLHGKEKKTLVVVVVVVVVIVLGRQKNNTDLRL